MSPESHELWGAPRLSKRITLLVSPSRMLHNLLKNKSQWRQRRRNVEERVCRTDPWVYSLCFLPPSRDMQGSWTGNVFVCLPLHAGTCCSPPATLSRTICSWKWTDGCCEGAAVYHLYDLRWNWRILVLTFLWKTPNIRKRHNVKTLCKSTTAKYSDPLLKHHTVKILDHRSCMWTSRPGFRDLDIFYLEFSDRNQNRVTCKHLIQVSQPPPLNKVTSAGRSSETWILLGSHMQGDEKQVFHVPWRNTIKSRRLNALHENRTVSGAAFKHSPADHWGLTAEITGWAFWLGCCGGRCFQKGPGSRRVL